MELGPTSLASLSIAADTDKKLEPINKKDAIKTISTYSKKIISIITEANNNNNNDTIYLNEENSEILSESVIKIRSVSSMEKDPPLAKIANIPGFLLLVTSVISSGRWDKNFSHVQFELSWMLTNLLSGPHNISIKVLEANVLNAFFNLLNRTIIKLNSKDYIKEDFLLKSKDPEELLFQIIWAIGNIAGDATQHRDNVVEKFFLETIVDYNILFFSGLNYRFLEILTWSIGNCFRGNPKPSYLAHHINLIIPPSLMLLVKLVEQEAAVPTAYRSTYIEIIGNLCWEFSYIIEIESDMLISSFITNHGIDILVNLINRDFNQIHMGEIYQKSFNQEKFMNPAIRVLGSITSGTESETQAIIDCKEAFPCFRNILLHCNNSNTIKEVCWLLSNILAGTQNQINAVIEADIMPILITFMRSVEMKIRKEIVWSISNTILSGSNIILDYMVSLGIIPALCEFISIEANANDSKNKLLACILDGFEHLLEKPNDELDPRHNPKYLSEFYECGADKKLLSLYAKKNHDHHIYEMLERMFSIFPDVNEWIEEFKKDENFSFISIINLAKS